MSIYKLYLKKKKKKKRRNQLTIQRNIKGTPASPVTSIKHFGVLGTDPGLLVSRLLMLPLKGEFVILMSILNVAVMAIVRHDLRPLEKSNSNLRASAFLQHIYT